MEDFEKVIKAQNIARQIGIINEFGGEDIDPEFSKGLPVGHINAYGKQKQSDGSWKYVGKQSGGAAKAKQTTPKTPATKPTASQSNLRQKVGKIEFTMDKDNLRLRAKIGSNLTFIGGTNNNGYFDNMDSAKEFIDKNKEGFAKINTMNQLIYFTPAPTAPTAAKTAEQGAAEGRRSTEYKLAMSGLDKLQENKFEGDLNQQFIRKQNTINNITTDLRDLERDVTADGGEEAWKLIRRDIWDHPAWRAYKSN